MFELENRASGEYIVPISSSSVSHAKYRSPFSEKAQVPMPVSRILGAYHGGGSFNTDGRYRGGQSYFDRHPVNSRSLAKRNYRRYAKFPEYYGGLHSTFTPWYYDGYPSYNSLTTLYDPWEMATLVNSNNFYDQYFPYYLYDQITPELYPNPNDPYYASYSTDPYYNPSG